jgi:hypothetical protein
MVLALHYRQERAALQCNDVGQGVASFSWRKGRQKMSLTPFPEKINPLQPTMNEGACKHDRSHVVCCTPREIFLRLGQCRS